MADTPGLEPGAVRRGGSSPPSRISKLHPLCRAVALLVLLTSCAPRSASLPSPTLSTATAENQAFLDSSLLQASTVRRLREHLKLFTATPATPGSIDTGKILYRSVDEPGRRYSKILARDATDAAEQTIFYPAQLFGNEEFDILSLRLNPYALAVASVISFDPALATTLTVSFPGKSERLATCGKISEYQWLDAKTLAVIIEPSEGAQALYLYTPDSHVAPIKLYRAAHQDLLLSLKVPSSGGGLFLAATMPGHARLFFVDAKTKILRPIFSMLEKVQDLYSFALEQIETERYLALNRISKPPRILNQNGDILWQGTPNASIEELRGSSKGLYWIVRENGVETVWAWSNSAQGPLALTAPPVRSACSPALNFLPLPYQSEGLPLIALNSFLAPRMILLPELETKRLKVVSEDSVPPEALQFLRTRECVSAEIRADDGKFVHYSAIVPRDPSTLIKALLLKVYGAYGSVIKPHYDPSTTSLAREGIVPIFAHVRGGGEFGISGHEAARALRRERGILDLVSVARAVSGDPKFRDMPLILSARSAGALLAANALKKESALFKGVVLDSPFLDPFDRSVKLAPAIEARERWEWGDPNTAEGHSLLEKLSAFKSPPARFPPTLILAKLHDEITGIEQARRFLELVRESGQRQTYLYTSETGSHFGEHDLNLQRAEAAMVGAFILGISGH